MISSTPQLKSLIDWAKSNNFYISDKLQFVIKENSGSTVITSENISPNERLIECPNNFIIGPELAKSTFSKIEYNSNSSIDEEQVFIKFAFLYQVLLGKESDWYPYLSILPKDDEIISPFYFNDTDLQWLQGTNIAQELDSKRQIWETQYNQAIEKINSQYPNSPSYTLPLYIWANLIFMSRSFPAHIVDPNAKTSTSILVPVIDSLNHQPLTPIHWDCSKGTGFNLLSGQLINKGDEVFNNYGAKGNEELFIAYGFTIENNLFDVVSLRLPANIIRILSNIDDLPEDGVFHLTREKIPDNLKKAFQKIISLQRGEEIESDSILCKIAGLEELSKALEQKRKNLINITNTPENIRQQFAKYYRDGQIYIYDESIIRCRNEIKQLLTDTTNVIDVDILASTEKQFVDTIMSPFGTTTIDDILNQGLEDQLLMFYISRQLISNQLPWPESDQREDLTYYQEICDNIIPHLRETSNDFQSPKWDQPSTFSKAGIYLEKYGYNYIDSQGRDRFRCIIDLVK